MKVTVDDLTTNYLSYVDLSDNPETAKLLALVAYCVLKRGLRLRFSYPLRLQAGKIVGLSYSCNLFRRTDHGMHQSVAR